MAQVTLGAEGLLEADLLIGQHLSFAATFVHQDEEGEPIDHTDWTVKARQSRSRQAQARVRAHPAVSITAPTS